MCPLVIIGYLTAVYPSTSGIHDYQIVVTRLFFLFIAGAMARYIATGREMVSRELAELNEQLTVAEERNRIARELHDGVGHSLVNSVLNIELCERLVEKDPAEACRMLEQEKTELRSALNQVRVYVFHLRPAEIEGTDFSVLIKRYVSEFSKRTGFHSEVFCETDRLDLSSSGKMVMLRIVQEALSNIAKHSMARNVIIMVNGNPRGGVICTISDDGVGFDLGEAVEQMSSKRNYGLQSMKERAEAVGGEVEIESAPGEGTTVGIILPGTSGTGRSTARWSILQKGVKSVMRSRRTRKIITSGNQNSETPESDPRTLPE
jgi:two-component system sensor histidine kinase DegS